MTIESRGRAEIRQLECGRARELPFTSLVMITGLVLGIAQAGALETPRAAALATLVKAYPDFLDRIEGNDLVWKDGTRQRIDDGKPLRAKEPFEAMLDDPDIKDMFANDLSRRRQGPRARREFRPRAGSGTRRCSSRCTETASKVQSRRRLGRHRRLAAQQIRQKPSSSQRSTARRRLCRKSRTNWIGCRAGSWSTCDKLQGATTAGRSRERTAQARMASASP